MTQLTPNQLKARERICLALDVPTVDEAIALAGELHPYIGRFKIGMQLHNTAGHEARNIVGEVYQITQDPTTFLDLKWLDIPQTVKATAKAAAQPGVYMANIHIAGGGEAMCKAALEGMYEGAQERNIPTPKVIGVTVLTSMDDDDLAQINLGQYDDEVLRRAELAKKWGLDGIVCPARIAGEMEKRFGEWIYATPGIQYGDTKGDGQKQLYTTDLAVQDSKYSRLVIGSALRKAPNRVQRAKDILNLMAPYV